MRKGLLLLCIAGLFTPAASEAAYPGANGDIAFSRSVNGSYLDVFAAAPDGSNLRNVTNSPSRDDHDPVWSAQGSKLAFWSVPYVATINADGSGQADLRWGGEPTFSPDGSRIAYSTTARFFPESNQEIFVMDSDGSNTRNLTNEPLGPEWGHDFAPAWSPDGEHIAFSRILGSATGIYVIDADGTNLTQLVSGSAQHPDWAPDGTGIVFDAFGDIFLVDVRGILRYVSAGDDGYPVFSPDGTKIAFQRFDSAANRYDLMVMNADGSGADLGIADARQPDWQPVQNRPPDCSNLTATPFAFERSDRRLRIVQVGGAADPDGDSVDFEATGVTQDEPVVGPGDHTRPDARLLSGDTVRVRAERSARGDGRVYRIAVKATDSHGAGCTGTATVAVPRHRNRAAVDSAPPDYDSLGS